MNKLLIYTPPEIDDSISSEEEHTYGAEVRSFNNNDEIVIIIRQRDALLDIHRSFLHIDGKLISDAVPANVEADRITLSNNAAAYLFELISYEVNNIELDGVRDVGTVSTVKTYLCYKKDEVQELSTSGWKYNQADDIETFNHTDNTFTFRIPLKHLINLPYDYPRVISGHHRLRLIRSRTDDNCYISTGDQKAQIQLTNVELKVKHVYPNDQVKLQLLEQINRNRVISLPFRKWEIHELPTLNSTNKEIWRVKTSTQLEKPRYVILCFQTNKKNNPKADVTLFDHCNLRSVR